MNKEYLLMSSKFAHATQVGKVICDDGDQIQEIKFDFGKIQASPGTKISISLNHIQGLEGMGVKILTHFYLD